MTLVGTVLLGGLAIFGMAIWVSKPALDWLRRLFFAQKPGG